MADDDERIVQEHDGYTHGQAVKIADADGDYEDRGMVDGEEGTLHICEVGSEEHGNKRVALYFVPEGNDEPFEQIDPDHFDVL